MTLMSNIYLNFKFLLSLSLILSQSEVNFTVKDATHKHRPSH